MAIVHAGTSAVTNFTTATAAYAITGLSIPSGSAVVAFFAQRSNSVTNTYTITTTPASIGTWTSTTKVTASEQSNCALVYAKTITSTMTAFTLTSSASAFGDITLAWFSGVDSAGTVVNPTGLLNATANVQWSPAITPGAAGDAVCGIGCGSISASAIDADGVITSRSGTTAATWTTVANILGGAGASTSSVPTVGGLTITGTAGSHQMEYQLPAGSTKTHVAYAIALPAASGGGGPTTFRRQGKRVW